MTMATTRRTESSGRGAARGPARVHGRTGPGPRSFRKSDKQRLPRITYVILRGLGWALGPSAKATTATAKSDNNNSLTHSLTLSLTHSLTYLLYLLTYLLTFLLTYLLTLLTYLLTYLVVAHFWKPPMGCCPTETPSPGQACKLIACAQAIPGRSALPRSCCGLRHVLRPQELPDAPLVTSGDLAAQGLGGRVLTNVSGSSVMVWFEILRMYRIFKIK